VLSFDNTFTNKHNHPVHPFLSSSFQSVKQEHKEEMPSDDVTHNQSSSSDYLVSPDQTAFDSFYNMTVLSSPVESDDNGVLVGSVDHFADDDLMGAFSF
jgi:hypothetical protein